MIRISLTLAALILSLNNALATPFAKDPYWYEIRDLTKLNHVPLTEYSDARAYLMQQIHLDRDNSGYFIKEVYCHIRYRKKVSPRTMPNHNELNVEHTWPQSRFNKRESKITQKTDLHHLFPSDSRTNGKRGHLHFSEFQNGQDAMPHCQASKVGYISGTGREGFEPPDQHKGNVARAIFYFSVRYDLRLDQYEEFTLRQWNLFDLVDSDELKRNDQIEKIQGNRNPFIDDPEISDLITNF
jgi:deoxyribonuclease-1